MRIIKGQYKDKEIPFTGVNTRPLTQKIKRSLFDSLENYVHFDGTVVYDICAGTGSFGIETLSRGAKFVYFIEKCRKTYLDLNKTMKFLSIDEQNVSIIHRDILHSPTIPQTADIIFIDPPFEHMLIEKILHIVLTKYATNPDVMIVVRADYDFEYSADEYTLIFDKKLSHGIVRGLRIRGEKFSEIQPSE